LAAQCSSAPELGALRRSAALALHCSAICGHRPTMALGVLRASPAASLVHGRSALRPHRRSEPWPLSSATPGLDRLSPRLPRPSIALVYGRSPRQLQSLAASVLGSFGPVLACVGPAGHSGGFYLSAARAIRTSPLKQLAFFTTHSYPTLRSAILAFQPPPCSTLPGAPTISRPATPGTQQPLELSGSGVRRSLAMSHSGAQPQHSAIYGAQPLRHSRRVCCILGQVLCLTSPSLGYSAARSSPALGRFALFSTRYWSELDSSSVLDRCGAR